MRRTLIWLAIGPLVCGGVGAGQRPGPEQFGRAVKLRVLVDKVLQRHKGWVTEEWMIREAAEAGFNVYSPRQGGGDIEAVRKVTRWCGQHGLYHLPWMRGTLRAPADGAEGERLVWADGTVSRLYSPNADRLWDWMAERIVAYARIAAKDATLLGVFLDYENYEGTGKPNGYGLSYDLGILRRFAAGRGVELPKLAPAARKRWLVEREIHDAFEKFQIDHWKQRCRALRQAVDRHAPPFRFCVYPAPGTKLIVEAIYGEWATKRAPLILADASTYGRPLFLPLAESLEHNRTKLVERRKVAEKAGIAFLYAGGIDPVVWGADPEFSGKNAVMISQATDGYWIFYEGPTYTQEAHRQYWRWFTWANRAIATGQWARQHEPRQTPRQWNFRLWHELGKARTDPLKPAAAAWASSAGAGAKSYPPVRLRGENLLLVDARRGRPVTVELRHLPVARYRSLLGWELRNLSRTLLAAGTIQPNAAGKVTFTPKADGVHLLAVSAGPCAYSLVRSDAAVGLYAGPGCPLSVIRGAKRLYFRVAAGAGRFTVNAATRGRETVRLTVSDPAGRPAATGQTTPARESLRLSVPAAAGGAGLWSLALTKADEGVLEDASVSLGGLMPPVLLLLPPR